MTLIVDLFTSCHNYSLKQ